MDVRKRKHEFGSAEKDRKYNRANRADWYFADNSISKDNSRFHPKCTSSAEKKSWGDIMDEYDNYCDYTKSQQKKDPPRSRRKIPLGEVNENKPAKFCGAKSKKHAVALPIEKDERKLATRQRQIEIGKNTPGYKRYLEDVPRMDRTSEHPWTPNKFTVCSTRSWQGVMRIWRRKLHYWDPPEVVAKRNQDSFLDFSSTSTTESEDACHTKFHIDNSMETDECFSSEGSQASSTDGCKPHEDDFYSLGDEINNDADLFAIPFV